MSGETGRPEWTPIEDAVDLRHIIQHLCQYIRLMAYRVRKILKQLTLCFSLLFFVLKVRLPWSFVLVPCFSLLSLDGY